MSTVCLQSHHDADIHVSRKANVKSVTKGKHDINMPFVCKKNTKNKWPVNKCSELWKSMCTTKDLSFVESFYIFNIILQKVMSPLCYKTMDS